MLKIESVDVFYGDVQALSDVTLKVEKGEIVSIIGSNGAGKTTMIWAICGLLPLKRGTITYKEYRIDKIPTYKLASLGLSIVPEGRKLFAAMTVRENLLMGAYCQNNKKIKEQSMEWVCNLFPRLKERMNQTVGTMSGGEQQMCAIARAMMSNPRFLILDEPSLGIAPNLVDQIFDTIIKIRKENDVTILLVEQNAQLALEIGDRGYVLENGRIVISDTAKNLLESKDIQKAYLGI